MLHACIACFELPSNISTMALTQIYGRQLPHGQTQDCGSDPCVEKVELGFVSHKRSGRVNLIRLDPDPGFLDGRPRIIFFSLPPDPYLGFFFSPESDPDLDELPPGSRSATLAQTTGRVKRHKIVQI